jgi:hypothetical protein
MIAMALATFLVISVSYRFDCERSLEMTRRKTGNMNGEQYLGDTSTKNVHDLDNEKTAANQCQINEIISAGHDKPFTTLAAAHGAGYSDCDYCL